MERCRCATSPDPKACCSTLHCYQLRATNGGAGIIFSLCSKPRSDLLAAASCSTQTLIAAEQQDEATIGPCARANKHKPGQARHHSSILAN
eukprot:5351088-Amphidinium_carterae.1